MNLPTKLRIGGYCIAGLGCILAMGQNSVSQDERHVVASVSLALAALGLGISLWGNYLDFKRVFSRRTAHHYVPSMSVVSLVSLGIFLLVFLFFFRS